MNENTPMIFGKIAAAIADVEAVGKNHRNAQQNYSFRSIDDFYDAVQPVFAKHRIFIAPTILEHHREERQTKSGGVMMTTLTKVRYRIYAEDGSFIEADALGEGADSGDKSANKSATTAIKYMMQQVFAIRVNGENLDTERDSPQYQPRPNTPPPQKSVSTKVDVQKPEPPRQYDLKPAEPFMATDKYRERMLDNLRQFDRDHLLDFAVHKGWLRPEENLNQWPLGRVPTTREMLGELVRDIENFVSTKVDIQKPAASDEPFWDAIITLPRAGMKRDVYFKNPDTIRSLYASMKSGHEKDRHRFWGIVQEYFPETRIVEGKEIPPTVGEVNCRKALDAFAAWHKGKE